MANAWGSIEEQRDHVVYTFSGLDLGADSQFDEIPIPNNGFWGIGVVVQITEAITGAGTVFRFINRIGPNGSDPDVFTDKTTCYWTGMSSDQGVYFTLPTTAALGIVQCARAVRNARYTDSASHLWPGGAGWYLAFDNADGTTTGIADVRVILQRGA